MVGFLDSDRSFLMRAYKAALEAKHPPEKLGIRPEPTWAALVVQGDKEIASASFTTGDGEDAVAKIFKQIGAVTDPSATLYLTLEPKAGFHRLPPVTESIRKLGVKRVAIGTMDPAVRYRGEGTRTLEQMGIEVVHADGEEARFCQQLLEDYAKWLQKGLAVLRAQGELVSRADTSYDLKFSGNARSLGDADALLCRAGGPKPVDEEAWRVVIDSEGWERPADRTILYQVSPQAGGLGVRTLPVRDGTPDLGAVLRDLGTLGILSVELAGEPELFRLAFQSGLIDSVKASFDGKDDSSRALSHLGSVQLAEGGDDSLEIKLQGARLVGGHLEANVELPN